MKYEDRIPNGSSFKTEEDTKNEREVAAILEKYWGCKPHEYKGKYNPIDWYFTNEGAIWAFAELKSRTYESTKYFHKQTGESSVFLNFRKWMALKMAEAASGSPGIFVARFTDGVFWIKINEVDLKTMEMGGCRNIVKSTNDIEPIIHVFISDMTKVKM